MGFADEVADAAQSKGPACTMGQILLRMDDDLREQVEAVLDGPGVNEGGPSARAIADALAGRGYELAHEIVNRHRQGRCRCGK